MSKTAVIKLSRTMCEVIQPHVPHTSFIAGRVRNAVCYERSISLTFSSPHPAIMYEIDRRWPSKYAQELLGFIERALASKKIHDERTRRGLEARRLQLEDFLDIDLIKKIARLDTDRANLLTRLVVVA